MEELDITAIAKNEFATVKIADSEYSTSNEANEIVSISSDTNTIEIIVKAENGEEKVYTVTINRVSDLGLKSVVVNGVECKEKDGIYEAYIDEKISEVGVSIKPNDVDVLVSTKTGDEEFTEAVAKVEHTLSVTTEEGKETIVIVNVIDPENKNRSKTYSISIKEKSHDAEVEQVKVDGKDAIKQEEKYHVLVSDKLTSVTVFVKANDANASVNIANKGNEIASSQRVITLSTDKITTVTFTITAQDGITTKTYTLDIEKQSSDTTCSVTVDNAEMDLYDEKTSTFIKYVERSATSAVVAVTATSNVATVEMAGNIAVHTNSTTVGITGDISIVNFTVKAENGDSKTYHVKLLMKSTDNTIATVKVNDNVIEEKDGKYTVTLFDNGKAEQPAKIEVITNNENAQVQIGDGTEWFKHSGKSTVTFRDNNRKIVLNLNVKPQDTNTEVLVKELEINLISDDNTVKVVKNGDEVVEEYDAETHTYTAYVKNETQNVMFVVETNSIYATITSGENSGLGTLALDSVNVEGKDEITIKFIVISELGNEQEYTIRICKMSNNANISYIYVDGEDIMDKFENLEDVPTCILPIERLKNSARIEVKGENNYSEIQIGDCATQIGKSIQNISLNLEENSITVPVVITSQDGTVTKTYNIIFARLSNNTNIKWLEINDKHIIEDDDGNYETTVKASEENAKIEII